MKKSAYVHFSISLMLIFALLMPTFALAGGGDGKKHFKAGMKAEVAEQWDRAVEEFALAVVDDPKNPEYRLHYQRAIFNASQMYVRRGAALAEQKDYAGAYLAFRKSYAYDPTNELAKSEMERMLRLQKGLENGDQSGVMVDAVGGDVKLVKTGFQNPLPQDVVIPQKLEKLRDVPFPGGVDLQYLIKELSKDLDLNVLFDSQAPVFRSPRKISIELKNVTAAKALDYIFLQENLFFQKVGPRTILVSEINRRPQLQQLVLRTFYLANADPTEVAKIVQQAIPAQPGRVPTIPLIDKATNSITLRDTSENIRIIGNLIKSLDKDRAEVVMDVQIYEVSKTDLLQFGNQIGDSNSLINLGGSTRGVIGVGGSDIYGGTAGATAASIIPRAFGVGVVVPAINLIALQDKQNTKLVASTQIHAFNNEDSSARIGRRVPVQTAQLLGYGNNQQGGNQGGGINNGFNNAANVISYEQVGLTLKFTPIVFPNQDVQVKMKIESKDVTGTTSLTPIFTERTIEGTARVQNNKTLLLASVAQNSESNGRTGLPLLGLLPFVGRLFTAPKKDNAQTDIVIAVTPRVIRAPAILPEDEIERPTGSVGTPTSSSLEAMIIEEEIEEQLAAARKIPNVAKVQLPDQKIDEPTYVKADANGKNGKISVETTSENRNIESQTDANSGIPALRPIDSGVETLQINQTADTGLNKTIFEGVSLKSSEQPAAAATVDAPTAEVRFLPNLPEMKAGEKTKIAVMVKSASAFRSSVLGLAFDNKKLSVKSVSFGEVFGRAMAQTSAPPFFNQGGKTYVSLASAKDISENSAGILAYIEVEALTNGSHDIQFDKGIMNFLTADGRNFIVKY